jgi:hypothetical protein
MVEAPPQRLQEIVDSTFKQLDRESLPNIQSLYLEFSNFLSTRGTTLFPGPRKAFKEIIITSILGDPREGTRLRFLADLKTQTLELSKYPISDSGAAVRSECERHKVPLWNWWKFHGNNSAQLFKQGFLLPQNIQLSLRAFKIKARAFLCSGKVSQTHARSCLPFT